MDPFRNNVMNITEIAFSLESLAVSASSLLLEDNQPQQQQPRRRPLSMITMMTADEEMLRLSTAKLCSKVHKAKDLEERRNILLTVAANPDYLKNLLSICEVSFDSFYLHFIH